MGWATAGLLSPACLCHGTTSSSWHRNRLGGMMGVGGCCLRDGKMLDSVSYVTSDVLAVIRMGALGRGWEGKWFPEMGSGSLPGSGSGMRPGSP